MIYAISKCDEDQLRQVTLMSERSKWKSKYRPLVVEMILGNKGTITRAATIDLRYSRITPPTWFSARGNISHDAVTYVAMLSALPYISSCGTHVAEFMSFTLQTAAKANE